ncbi:hypothetical protein ACLESO_33590, partial [Pyxidicoccus sp. 3LG]
RREAAAREAAAREAREANERRERQAREFEARAREASEAHAAAEREKAAREAPSPRREGLVPVGGGFEVDVSRDTGAPKGPPVEVEEKGVKVELVHPL